MIPYHRFSQKLELVTNFSSLGHVTVQNGECNGKQSRKEFLHEMQPEKTLGVNPYTSLSHFWLKFKDDEGRYIGRIINFDSNSKVCNTNRKL